MASLLHVPVAPVMVARLAVTSLPPPSTAECNVNVGFSASVVSIASSKVTTTWKLPPGATVGMSVPELCWKTTDDTVGAVFSISVRSSLAVSLLVSDRKSVA